MQARFWHERWESNQLGFHQSEVNPLLRAHWPRIDPPAGASVFVPLCGKSLDMHWLREAGHPVIGVEISPIAVADFFAEAGITPTRTSRGELERSAGEGFELYCGDFFALEKFHLAEVEAVYDRASLIALPEEMRARYASHLAEILPESVSGLLITIEYDQARMDGPPHSVPAEEVEDLFGAAFEIERLWSSGPVAPTDRFRERGLTVWTETAWRLSRGTMTG
jgi:thiopurine S-methyltransferase